MTNGVEVIVLTALAGLAIPLGGLLARVERIQPRWLELEFRHSVTAFGGGILLAAVALVLVPEGSRNLPVPAVIAAMGLGGAAFCLLDIALARAYQVLGEDKYLASAKGASDFIRLKLYRNDAFICLRRLIFTFAEEPGQSL
jgi:hypothetical protein